MRKSFVCLCVWPCYHMLVLFYALPVSVITNNFSDIQMNAMLYIFTLHSRQNVGGGGGGGGGKEEKSTDTNTQTHYV